MRGVRFFPYTGVILVFVLSACSASGAGPQTWIDWPLDNTRVPLEPLIMQAHASDSNGVRSLVFMVSGTQIGFSAVSGGRLETASIEWAPPGPGTYTVQVYAVDTAGNQGATATSLVIVGGQEPVSRLILPDAESLAGDQAMDSGEVLEPAMEVPQPTEAPPEAPPAEATQPPPPAPKTQPTQQVPPPTNTSPAPAQPPPDTFPPNVTYVDIYPDYILTQGGGCAQYARVASSTVNALDDSGIYTVFGDWVLGNQSGTVVYNVLDDSTFQGDFGPVDTTGIMYINGAVLDNAGNNTPFSLQVTVDQCIE